MVALETNTEGHNFPDSTNQRAQPHPDAAQEYDEACSDIISLMPNVEAVEMDLDGIYLNGGIIPRTPEGHLDIDALNIQSPYTIPILECMNELELRGVPPITITGKSFTAVWLEDFRRTMKFERAYELGMLNKPYHREPHTSGIVFSSEIDIKPEFIEPQSGQMRAIDINGNPSPNKLVLSRFMTDSGARKWNFGLGENEITTRKFPREFYEKFLNEEIQALLRDTTRDSKIKRQEDIRQHYYLFPKIDINEYRSRMPSLTNKELWELAVVTTFDHSYPSPFEGAKFNGELGLKKLLTQERLRNRWTSLAKSLGYENFNPMLNSKGIITNEIYMKDVEELVYEVLTRLFPPDVAAISINFVNEKGRGMGKRTVIDFNPPHTDKLQGFMLAIQDIHKDYKKANLLPPRLLKRSIKMGDGPHQNDESVICLWGGWTNFDEEHDKFMGFPAYNGDLLPRLGIQLATDETKLSKLEHTLLFMRLILFARFNKPLNNLPETIREKLIIPQEYFSFDN